MTQQFIRLIAIVAASFALATSVAANCDECFSARQSVSQERGKLIRDFPGTGATLVACMATCAEQPKSERGGCVIASCGVACMFIGMNHCFDFFNRFAAVNDRVNRVEKFCSARRCN